MSSLYYRKYSDHVCTCPSSSTQVQNWPSVSCGDARLRARLWMRVKLPADKHVLLFHPAEISEDGLTAQWSDTSLTHLNNDVTQPGSIISHTTAWNLINNFIYETERRNDFFFFLLPLSLYQAVAEYISVWPPPTGLQWSLLWFTDGRGGNKIELFHSILLLSKTQTHI